MEILLLKTTSTDEYHEIKVNERQYYMPEGLGTADACLQMTSVINMMAGVVQWDSVMTQLWATQQKISLSKD